MIGCGGNPWKQAMTSHGNKSWQSVETSGGNPWTHWGPIWVLWGPYSADFGAQNKTKNVLFVFVAFVG